MDKSLVIILTITAAVVIRLAMGSMDHDRITQYILSRGGRVLSIHWDPFGPGWWGEKSDRIYQVRYVDGDGNERSANCKTSMWTGVYFSNDTVVRASLREPEAYMKFDYPAIGGRQRDLEEENRRLRQEIARLREQLGSRDDLA